MFWFVGFGVCIRVVRARGEWEGVGFGLGIRMLFCTCRFNKWNGSRWSTVC